MGALLTRKQRRIVRVLTQGFEFKSNRHGFMVLDSRTVPTSVIDVMVADGLLERGYLRLTMQARKAVQL